jgi:hypothetical protein
MAEIQFFMDNDESFVLAAFLLEEFGIRFVPEKNPEPTPIELTTLHELRTHLASSPYAPRYFLLSPHWTKFPLYMHEIDSQGRHFFAVRQRHGGPAFDWIFARTFVHEEQNWIVPGMFSDYPWYMTNEGVEDTFTRPAAMKNAYKAITRFIRKGSCQSVCREHGFLGPWISAHALKAFHNGTWLRTGELHFEPKAPQ